MYSHINYDVRQNEKRFSNTKDTKNLTTKLLQERKQSNKAVYYRVAVIYEAGKHRF